MGRRHFRETAFPIAVFRLITLLIIAFFRAAKANPTGLAALHTEKGPFRPKKRRTLGTQDWQVNPFLRINEKILSVNFSEYFSSIVKSAMI